MKRRTKEFIQHLSHDFEEEDEEAAEKYLDDALPLIGLVVMYFNSVEKYIDSLICTHINERSDSVGLMVINGMSYGAKVELYKRFRDEFHLHVFGGKEPSKYKGLIDGLKEIGQLRNLVVHADWSSTDRDGFTYVKLKYSDKGMLQEYVQFSEESLMKIVEKILKVQHQLGEYEEDMLNPNESAASST